MLGERYCFYEANKEFCISCLVLLVYDQTEKVELGRLYAKTTSIRYCSLIGELGNTWQKTVIREARVLNNKGDREVRGQSYESRVAKNLSLVNGYLLMPYAPQWSKGRTIMIWFRRKVYCMDVSAIFF